MRTLMSHKKWWIAIYKDKTVLSLEYYLGLNKLI